MAKRNVQMRQGGPINKLLTILALVLIAAGLYMLFLPRYVRHKQDQIKQQLLDQLDNTEGVAGDDDYIWVDPNANILADEEVDYFIPDPDDPLKYIQVTPTPATSSSTNNSSTNTDTSEPAGTSTENLPSNTDGSGGSNSSGGEAGGSSTWPVEITNDQGQVGLQSMGRLVIDKIAVNSPMVTGLTRVHLRYAVAHYEITPLPGETGMSAIFAHRSPDHGRDLNRLNEVLPGDSFQIVRDNKTYHYLVEENIVVEPAEVLEYVFGSYNDDSYVMLVTCHPIPTWKQRMIVIARLVDVSY